MGGVDMKRNVGKWSPIIDINKYMVLTFRKRYYSSGIVYVTPVNNDTTDEYPIVDLWHRFDSTQIKCFLQWFQPWMLKMCFKPKPPASLDGISYLYYAVAVLPKNMSVFVNAVLGMRAGEFLKFHRFVKRSGGSDDLDGHMRLMKKYKMLRNMDALL
jgi:hypothetical protein